MGCPGLLGIEGGKGQWGMVGASEQGLARVKGCGRITVAGDRQKLEVKDG